MGTRSITHFIEKWIYEGKERSQILATVYRQMDGYPSGMGQDIADFLNGGKMVNGISIVEKERVFNGMGCLTAQFIAKMKQGAGGIYMVKPGSINHGENYRYKVIYDDNNEITMECYEVGYMKGEKYCSGTRKVFSGSPKDFAEFVKKFDE